MVNALDVCQRNVFNPVVRDENQRLGTGCKECVVRMADIKPPAAHHVQGERLGMSKELLDVFRRDQHTFRVGSEPPAVKWSA